MAWMIPIPFFIPDLLTAFGWLMLGNPQNGVINQLAQQISACRGRSSISTAGAGSSSMPR